MAEYAVNKVAATIEITLEDVKSYLGIDSTTDTWDAQIASVIVIWTETIESWIVSNYLTDDTKTSILTAAKTLYICGQVKNVIPANAVGLAGGMSVREKVGDYEYQIDTKGAASASSGMTGDGMIAQALQILKPYLAEDALTIEQQIKSTTQDHASEFQLERKDSSDNISVSGNMTHW